MLQSGRINERYQNDLDDSKRKLQTEVERLKEEILALHDKHQNDLDNEREAYKKAIL